MTFCTLITWLAAAAVILALLPWLLSALVRGNLLEVFQRLCDRLCRLWIFLAFVFGLVLGGIAFCCRDELTLWLDDNQGRQLVLLGLLVFLWLLYRFLLWVAHCGMDKLPSIRLGRVSISMYWLVVLLALLILWLVLRCCAGEAEVGTPGHTICYSLFLAAILLFLLLAVLRFATARACDPDINCEGVSVRLLLLLLWGFLVLWLVYRNCDGLVAEDHELAMVGIWWEGQHEDEAGAHLRWQFDIDVLDFPEGGFDLQRRPSAGGTWTTLNGAPIEPVTTWGDELAVTGDMWIAEGVERLHPDTWARFRDVGPDEQPFTDLVEMLALSGTAVLYYVEAPDPGVFAVAPSNPYLSEADRDAYLDSYHAAAPDALPLLTWDAEPDATIMTTALYPEIARMVGLYYIDETADPATEYDYRVVGYWLDRERTYIVERISGPNTSALDPPVVLTASSPAEVGELGGNTLFDDLAVELLWRPPDYDPNANLGVLDKVDSVLFHVEHQQLETDDDVIPACAGLVPGPTWGAAQRLEDGEPVPLPPVLPVPIEDPATGRYEWPEVFLRHRVERYGCHAYRLQGQDVFGRLSPHSGVRVVPVVDTTPPPPPSAVAARLYQAEDDSLTAAERARFFPSGSSNTLVLHVSWVWTEEAAERASDVVAFSMSLHHTDLDGLLTLDWSDPGLWDLSTMGADVDASATSALPVRLTSVGYDAADRFYEVALDDGDLGSLAAVGLDAGDFEPVEYAYVSVSAVDHAPYSNRGPVAPPVTVFARDLVPPDAPEAPFLSGGPFAADESGNRSLELSWNGVSHYTYAVYRVDGRDIEVESDVSAVDPTALPADCFPDGVPEQPAGMSDEDWLDLSSRFLLRAAAHGQPDGFARFSPLPLAVDGGSSSFLDTADGTTSRLYVYALTATDLAGNESALSCPGDAILVEDGIAPRAPVVRQLLGADNAIQITWTANPEEDLQQYVVYRTADETLTGSRRRMRLVTRLDAGGNDLTGASGAPDAVLGGTAPYDHLTFVDTPVTPGEQTFYRIEAVDIAGNRSALSEVAAARAFDQLPPDPPLWAADPTLDANADTQLAWQVPADDPELSYQVQRRATTDSFWASIGGWSDPGTASFLDTTVRPPDTYRYRLRAMDAAGNRSDWSEEREITIP